jgi:hypothetical protein
MAAQVIPPKDFALPEGHLCFEKDIEDEYAVTNAHLLGALGEFKDKPFVPVWIEPCFIGYSWTNLPKVTEVKINPGKEILRHSIRSGEIICVESLTVTVHTSDGKVFSSPVCMAVSSESHEGKYSGHRRLFMSHAKPGSG